MFTLDELFSKKNQRIAFLELSKKSNYLDKNGILLSEIETFWQLNQESILNKIRQKSYLPSKVYQKELLKKNGDRRKISQILNLDRFILKLLSQKLNRYLDPIFLDFSYAYREGKGVVSAVERARDLINSGYTYLLEIDLHHYFDNINLEKLMANLATLIQDECVLALIRSYLYCQVSFQNETSALQKGILQGSSISPVLCNLFLHDFDCLLEERGMAWVRFSDNIYLYFKNSAKAKVAYTELTQILENDFGLKINREKSGVFKALSRRVLGYDFLLSDGQVICQKHHYTERNFYPNWYQSRLREAHSSYYIIGDGILTQKDFSLLFETEEYKHHLPIACVEHLDVFSNVVISPSALKMLSDYGITLVLHDRFGGIISYVFPERLQGSANLLIEQCRLYLDDKRRLLFGQEFEEAHLFNLRANCRYYLKKMKGNEKLQDLENYLTLCLKAVARKKSVDDLMLLEARARQAYYEIYRLVLNQEDFHFEKRTKRPPRDEINALISFCNTILYSQVLRLIWQVKIEPKIGILHASNQRTYSLHLDFADYMKPVIVDRVIFSLINKHQINAKEHFQVMDDGAVLLNSQGKQIVLEALDRKLETRLVIDETSLTYRQLMARDIMRFKKVLQGKMSDRSFHLYKYY